MIPKVAEASTSHVAGLNAGNDLAMTWRRATMRFMLKLVEVNTSMSLSHMANQKIEVVVIGVFCASTWVIMLYV